MAQAVPSTASTNFGAGTTVVITKPTGLAEGDLMVAKLGAVSSGSSISYTTLSGWTLAANGNGSDFATSIQYKIATAGDVAASNFTFTCASAAYCCGAIMRVTGAITANTLADFDAHSDSSANSATLSFLTSASPIVSNSLVVIALLGASNNTGTGTISAYTTDPTTTFTETLDTTFNMAQDPIFGSAYSIYSGSSTITTYGATFSLEKEQHYGVIAIFSPLVNASGTTALLSADADFFSNAGMSDATGTAARHDASPTFFGANGEVTQSTEWSTSIKS